MEDFCAYFQVFYNEHIIKILKIISKPIKNKIQKWYKLGCLNKVGNEDKSLAREENINSIPATSGD